MFIHAILCLCVGAALGYEDTRTPPRPVWSTVYKVRGVVNLPTADVIEPFYHWYDGKNGETRIDYFDGMTKIFEFSSTSNKNGSIYYIIPVSTEEYLNKPKCASFHIKEFTAKSVLPNMARFKYIGVDKGTNTTIWQFKHNSVFGGIYKHTMYVKYQQTLSGDAIPVPVRYDGKSYDSSVSDHVFIEFSDYDVSGIDPSVFDVNSTGRKTVFDAWNAYTDATYGFKALIDRRLVETDSLIQKFVIVMYARYKAVELPLLCLPGVKCKEEKSPAYHYNPIMEYISLASDSVAQHFENEFDRFKTKHDKQYASQEEHATRKSIFRKNLHYIQSWNRAGRSFSLAVNHLADRTEDELAVLRGFRYSGPAPHSLPFPYSEDDIKEKSEELPSSFDWRIEGAVTPVENQLFCGSCWAFSATGAVEGALFLQNGGHLMRLSQQALIDCSWGFYNGGCAGGFLNSSYAWIMKHGLPTYDAYGGYLALDGYCHINNMTEVTKIKGWHRVTPNNEEALKLAIFKHGPVSVAIDADHRSFAFYSHGVYFEPQCDSVNLDHAVLAIGYGVLNGQRYWLVKNSWSDMWGDQGYILMSPKNNNCGVMTEATYVTI